MALHSYIVNGLNKEEEISSVSGILKGGHEGR